MDGLSLSHMFFDETILYSSHSVSISAIVGRNRSGKNFIFDMMVRLLNNVAIVFLGECPNIQLQSMCII